MLTTEETNLMFQIEGIVDKEAFLKKVFLLFASRDCVLTTWGNLSGDLLKLWSRFRRPSSWLRKVVFREREWELTPEIVPEIVKALCSNQRLGEMSLGVRKGKASLLVWRKWEEITIEGSGVIDDRVLLEAIDDLRGRGAIRNYETITD